MTQGILSVLERHGDPNNDKVIYKIIAGCDGGSVNLQRLGSELLKRFKQKGHLPNLEEIYRVARKHVGCEDCLVVMDSETALYKGEGELSERYRKTFNSPSFNPRWKQGIADAVERIIITPRKEPVTMTQRKRSEEDERFHQQLKRESKLATRRLRNFAMNELAAERDRLKEINRELLAVLKQCLLDHKKFALDGDGVLYNERLEANMEDAEREIAKAEKEPV